MRKNWIFIPALFAVLLTNCKSANNTQKGTAIGAAAGAGAGALIGGGGKSSVWGALIGAAVGGGAGYVIGHHMDKQAKEIKQAVPDAQVERVGEGINMTFNSGLLFQINSSALSEAAKTNLEKVAGVFVKYPETNILIEGHTDDTGTPEYNMELSKKRAYSVSDYLQSKGVSSSRMNVKWYGESQPKVPNTTDANRTMNRRVEVAITANEQMKQEAKDGKLN
ncbi:OmpA family protein [Flavitalea sp. BT771]|uniref:OmpA family protein n=1 Tax=Flavitalea sp. BT771 TaxID=3063329 RepID=UPI0026E3A424|nr:OmpA family protein [Flavitalea sp. BT771]MDO6432574.1 OmpA family protein [Flavitalea sp. BT771]MDV6222150.1 OmpA family protein [Flavitalea sp. BT771]